MNINAAFELCHDKEPVASRIAVKSISVLPKFEGFRQAFIEKLAVKGKKFHMRKKGGIAQMSIKPVDFQVIIPKMPEVSKLSSDMHQKGAIFQQQGNVELREEIDRDLKQVHHKENIRHGKVTRKEKENMPDSKEDAKQKKNKKKGNETIDVKI